MNNQKKYPLRIFAVSLFFIFIIETVSVAGTVCLFDEDVDMAANLYRREGGSVVSVEMAAPFSGAYALRITPPGAGATLVPLRENYFCWQYYVRKEPMDVEYRYVLFAWKKKGGERISLTFINDEYEGRNQSQYYIAPRESNPAPAVHRVWIGKSIPAEWQVEIRDLYADFGRMVITGIHLYPEDGDYALFDCIWLGTTREELEAVAAQAKPFSR